MKYLRYAGYGVAFAIMVLFAGVGTALILAANKMGDLSDWLLP